MIASRVLVFGCFLLIPLLALSCAGSREPVLPATPPIDAYTDASFQVLVFSRTNGYRHESIREGVELVRTLGLRHGFGVDATEDPSRFTDEGLEPYEAVVFMNTNGDVLATPQEAAFERYIQAGGGFVGVHSAAATEYDWGWYERLVGAHFNDHPEPQEATVNVLDNVHPSTEHLPKQWVRFDEWYNYRTNPRGNVHVLATLDESSYEGGDMGHDHPIAWAHEYDGGRAWYTGLGHTREVYADPAFQRHLLGGIEWAAGQVEADAGATVTANFDKKVLMEAVTDPMEIDIADDGRVFLVERAGAVKMWDPETASTSVIGWIPVYMIIEDGLLGLALDPRFLDNGWLYVFYAPDDGGPSRLSRFTVVDDRLDMESEKILLEIPVQRMECCHAGGSLAFDAEGNLYLSTGDNTDPSDRAGSPIDERPDRQWADAQRTSGNTNDLRGKILRIHPEPDGTYTIPPGNLFEGDALHRPEIYTMGHRNPFRIAVDHETGWLYWGDVGNGDPPNERGGWGWDEFNQAKGPGNFGWPHFSGKNQPYNDYDYATGVIGAPFDPEKPINDSPHNTGAQELPPAQPAWIAYTYGMSEDFPELGAGGINPMAGPVYRKPESAAPYALPEYYEGSALLYEWMRNWVMEVEMDEEGQVVEISPFLPGVEFVRPMDMEIGPDGALYVAEWGDTFWGSNDNARVVRVEYRPDAEAAPVARTETYSEKPASNAGPGVVIETPAEGSFFAFDEPMPYRVVVKDEAGRPVEAADVVVNVYSGFDTHALLLEEHTGDEGHFTVSRKYTHTPDIHYVDRFAELEACYTASQDDEVCSSVKLQPVHKEAEHIAWKRGGTRHTHGPHPASSLFPYAALTVMQLNAGDTLAYAPVHLKEVQAVTLRYKPSAPGTLLLGASPGAKAPLARLPLNVDSVDVVEEVEQIAASHDALTHDEALAADLEALDKSAFENWSEVTVPIDGAGEAGELILTLESDHDDAVVELDWLLFHKK